MIRNITIRNEVLILTFQPLKMGFMSGSTLFVSQASFYGDWHRRIELVIPA